MSLATKISAIITVGCLIASATCAIKHCLNDKNGVNSKMPLFNMTIIFFMAFFYCLIATLYFNMNKCVECNMPVNTAYCVQCGTENDKYVEFVEEIRTGLMCPICEDELTTLHCGSCGAEAVLVEAN